MECSWRACGGEGFAFCSRCHAGDLFCHSFLLDTNKMTCFPRSSTLAPGIVCPTHFGTFVRRARLFLLTWVQVCLQA